MDPGVSCCSHQELDPAASGRLWHLHPSRSGRATMGAMAELAREHFHAPEVELGEIKRVIIAVEAQVGRV